MVELDDMSSMEFTYWQAYFKLKAAAEKRATKKDSQDMDD